MTGMIATTIRVNLRHPEGRREQRDVCALHSRVLDMTVGMPDNGPRVLYARPRPDLLVVRAAQPVTAARLPAGYAATVTSREWVMPTTAGRWRMVAVLNPGRRDTTGGPTLAQPDRPRLPAQPVLYRDEERQREWLRRRLCAGGRDQMPSQLDDTAATVDTFRIIRTATTVGHHSTGGDRRTITVRQVTIAAVIAVHNPVVVCRSVIGGVGMDKTWGCGLTMWEPAC